MYTITRPAYKIGTGGGTYEVVPEETRTFLTGAGLLKWALKERLLSRHGGGPYPVRFDDRWLGDPDRPHSGYEMIDTLCRWEFKPEHRVAMQRAARRYREIIHYLREVEPEWVPDTSGSPTGLMSFGDNSVERHEINKYGERRHIMVEYPHGDACF